MQNIIQEQHTKIATIVDNLYTIGIIRTSQMVQFKEYKKAIESEIESLTFLLEGNHTNKPEAVQSRLTEFNAEAEWLNQTTIYRSSYVDILDMYSIVRDLFWKQHKGSRDEIWTFKKLVEMINGYYAIKEPYKTSYKIAYGWNFALSKNNFRPYLFGCIRNYLKKNGVEFDTADLQRICALRDDHLQWEK